VGPAQRIAACDVGPNLRKISVDDRRDAIVRAHTKMMTAPRADVGIRQQIAPVKHLTALRAFAPERGFALFGLLRAARAQPLRHRRHYCPPDGAGATVPRGTMRAV